MTSTGGMAILVLLLGGWFLGGALASTLSKVALLTEVRHSEHPRAFLALVSIYWVLGLVGVGVGIAALFGDFRG
jgi:hypothetical protein